MSGTVAPAVAQGGLGCLGDRQESGRTRPGIERRAIAGARPTAMRTARRLPGLRRSRHRRSTRGPRAWRRWSPGPHPPAPRAAAATSSTAAEPVAQRPHALVDGHAVVVGRRRPSGRAGGVTVRRKRRDEVQDGVAGRTDPRGRLEQAGLDLRTTGDQRVELILRVARGRPGQCGGRVGRGPALRRRPARAPRRAPRTLRRRRRRPSPGRPRPGRACRRHQRRPRRPRPGRPPPVASVSEASAAASAPSARPPTPCASVSEAPDAALAPSARAASPVASSSVPWAISPAAASRVLSPSYNSAVARVAPVEQLVGEPGGGILIGAGGSQQHLGAGDGGPLGAHGQLEGLDGRADRREQ